ncbi:MAG: lipopolysaccharide transport periplasmic protein LptA [Betaproteobacteria bacterium]|nr:lipopolysaccharide transport periplasmic protein LptA [Betaproteobacteria bacterium]
MKQRSINPVFALILLALALPALAEKTDRDKPVNVESDTAYMDDVKKIGIYEGRVVLIQGTLKVHAQRLEVQQDAEGFSSADAVGAPAYFREKQENSEEYVEGWAKHIEYDGRAEKVKLTGLAHVKRGIDDLRGEVVTYDQKTGQFNAVSATGAPVPGTTRRVHAVIRAKEKTTTKPVAPAPAPALPVAQEKIVIPPPPAAPMEKTLPAPQP